MIGIYKIENKLNGKCYIGQSVDIERRFKEHCYKGELSRIPLDLAIRKYGVINFEFSVLEECSIEDLNERECYWISFYKSDMYGYNCNIGGDSQTIGEQNGRSKLTDNDVRIIRKAYNNHERSKDVYNEFFKDKISYAYFLSVWEGHFWKHVMPEVLTEENRLYYMSMATNGEMSPQARMSDRDVLLARERYQTETARQIYDDMKPDVLYGTFQAILWGRYYKHLPIYDKKRKIWK